MKLKRKTLFFFGLVDLPISMSLFPVAVFIPKFYASDMAVPLSVVGAILFFVRWTDVVTDPLMGYISDHTRSRFGRRKLWIALSTPIMMFAVYNLFLPDTTGSLGQIYQIFVGADKVNWLHLGVWSFVLSVAITMMLIPYYAWGAELSTDYNERSMVTGSRAVFNALGSLSAISALSCKAGVYDRRKCGSAAVGRCHHAGTDADLCHFDAQYGSRGELSADAAGKNVGRLKAHVGQRAFQAIGHGIHDWFDRIEYNHATLHILYRLYPRRRGTWRSSCCVFYLLIFLRFRSGSNSPRQSVSIVPICFPL